MLVLRLVVASGSWPQQNVIYDYQTSINPCISRLGRSCVLHCYSMRLTNPSEWVYLIIIGMLLCGKISASNLWSSCTSSISNVIFQTYDIKNVAKNSWVCSINKTKQLQNCWWNIRTDVCISQETQCKKKKKNWQQGNRKVFSIPNYTNWSELLCAGLCPWVEVNRILQNSTEMTPVILKKSHLHNGYIPKPTFME